MGMGQQSSSLRDTAADALPLPPQRTTVSSYRPAGTSGADTCPDGLAPLSVRGMMGYYAEPNVWMLHHD